MNGPAVDLREGLRALEKLHGRVLVRAEDRDSAVTIDVEESRIRIADGERPDARMPPPRLGEHGAEILAEAGYTPDEASALLAGPCAPE